MLQLADAFLGGTSLTYPTGGIGLMMGFRALQTPTVSTNLAQGLYKTGNLAGGIAGKQIPQATIPFTQGLPQRMQTVGGEVLGQDVLQALRQMIYQRPGT
jgi:hypothetical protein